MKLKDKGQTQDKSGRFTSKIDEKTRQKIREMLEDQVFLTEMIAEVRRLRPDIGRNSTYYSWIEQVAKET